MSEQHVSEDSKRYLLRIGGRECWNAACAGRRAQQAVFHKLRQDHKHSPALCPEHARVQASWMVRNVPMNGAGVYIVGNVDAE